MYCGNCGKNIPDGSKFCEGCGAPVAQTAPQQPQYQPQPQYQAQPQYQKPVTKKKSPVLPIVIAAVAVVVLAAVIAVIALVGGKAPMSELFAYGDWNYGSFELYDGTYVIRSASTDETDRVEEIWDSISELKVKEKKSGDADAIRAGANINLFMMEESGENTVYMAVTQDGQMYVNYNDDATRYFSGCQEVYDALNGFLPSGDEASLEECIPDGDWSTVLITFYAPDGSTYDDAYISDMEYAAGFVDRLQSYNAKFGGGTYLDFEGYYASVSLFDEADTMFHFTVFEDGNADFPMDDWTVGFYDAVDIYDMLWEELCVINGYY